MDLDKSPLISHQLNLLLHLALLSSQLQGLLELLVLGHQQLGHSLVVLGSHPVLLWGYGVLNQLAGNQLDVLDQREQ